MIQYFKFYIFILLTIFTSYTTFSQLKENTIYLIPGQGSDYRIFKYFKLQNIDTVHIHFIIPNKNETMKSYAQRLSKQIDTSKTFSIIGVSLGGMLAVEISEFLKPEKVIIISSAKNRNELPFKYKFMLKIPLNKLFGGRFLRTVAPLAQLIFEPDSKKERETCKAMLKNKNIKFMKRSVNMIVNWERKTNSSNIIHIHGDNDNTIPIKRIKDLSFCVKNGSHMMTITKGNEINKLVNKILKE